MDHAAVSGRRDASQELGEPEDAHGVPGPGARDRAIKTEI